MNTDVMFSSEKSDWETPPSFFNNLPFNFTLDVCARKDNTKCKNFITPEQNSLITSWGNGNVCWMNPPYGKGIDKWIEKAWKESKQNEVIALLPSRTDTKYFHNYVLKAEEIYFIKGRLKFVGAKHPAPFPSILVRWSPYITELKIKQMDNKACII